MLMKSTLLAIAFVFCACVHTVAPLTLIGKWHTVEKGDTVNSVAAKYNVSPEVIAELNALSAHGKIVGREQVFIPLKEGKAPGDGKPPKKVSPVTTFSSESNSSDTVSTTSGGVIGRCGEENRPCYLWPVDGTFSRAFGDDGEIHHDGIDIEARKGTAVVAAEDGEVLYSGDAIKGYGNLLLIRHKDKNITVYAHNDKNLTKEGVSVKRGEKIAEVGQSGAATRDHLHFEVRVNEQPVDPMLYLPSRK